MSATEITPFVLTNQLGARLHPPQRPRQGGIPHYLCRAAVRYESNHERGRKAPEASEPGNQDGEMRNAKTTFVPAKCIGEVLTLRLQEWLNRTPSESSDWKMHDIASYMSTHTLRMALSGS